MTTSPLSVGYDYGRSVAEGTNSLIAELRRAKVAIDGVQGKTVTVDFTGNSFDRYANRARRALVLAQEQARVRGHHYVGSEHLVLGLVHEAEGVAAHVLTTSCGVTAESFSALIDYPSDAETEPPPIHIPFSAETKKVLELALREALMLGRTYIDTEHLLLAVIRHDGSRGLAALKSLGVNPAKLRQELLRWDMTRANFGSKPSEDAAALVRIEEKLDAITRAFKSIGLHIPPGFDPEATP